MEQKDCKTPIEGNTAQTKRTLILCVLVIAAVLLYSVFTGRQAQYAILAEEEYVSIMPPQGDGLVLQYDGIFSCTMVNLPDYGALVSGTDEKKCRCGIWSSETWGEYYLCVNPETPLCIALETDDGYVVINQPSAAATQSLWAAIDEHLTEQST